MWGLPMSTVVELPRGILNIPLGTVVGIVSWFTTLEASIAPSRSRVGISHRCIGGSVLAIMQKVRAWH